MTQLPTEAALRDMRTIADIGFNGNPNDSLEAKPETMLALLDCALMMRRLERWIAGDPDWRTMFNAGKEGAEWHVELHYSRGPGVEFFGTGPDLLTALAAALDRAEAGK